MMATVRFSKELQEEIIKNAKGVFGKQLETAKNNRPENEWGEKIYDILYGQYANVLNAVPQMFLTTNNKFKVDQVGSLSCSLEFTLNSAKPFPKEIPDTEYAKKSSGYYGNEYILKDHLVWGEFHADVKRWLDGIKAVNVRQEEFVKQVQQIITAHATLAPALKMWPPLWDLVPEQYKERHRTIVERTKNDVEVNVDLSSMTAAVVANKITR
jgi:hypothetical protein